ncbi:GTPase [Planctomyces sp. SH-PL14]|uniref:GTPase n=1 Tax=Planctomyces sp. SH-PL14 TaxID=1632864 RepID=UPI00078C687F|nr:GTPase [Planctomyces sp. SH-PL14]AMV19500.1 hypothetical protein VT03_16520 [Planctomyces sp. SH-PL14]
MASLSEYAERTRRLHNAVRGVERRSAVAQVPPLPGREWFELLERKLLPQLTDDSYLVVAVVGGTNIGKSCVFNHVAGFRASAVSPLASGTKHPTCLVPAGFLQRHDLSKVFPGFTLKPWEGAEAPLVEEGVDWLFWRECPELPPNLLVLDTPDVDSDARINWVRADNIRRAADVLLAVLTQQKYNDAAVKEFFRNAAAEDKACLIVLNQVLLPEDEPWWPKWLATFCQETQVKPEIVYIAPNDRRAAEQNRLPFYERPWPLPEGASASGLADPDQYNPGPPRNLLEDLTNLRFAEIKVRTLRGSLNHLLDESAGAPGYLREVRQRAGQFRGAAELLTAHQLAATDHWPAIPASILIGELRKWWAAQRTGWSAKVHGFYNTVGTGLAWPFKKVAERIQGESRPPLELYRDREWSAILDVVQKVFDKLTFISELGNDLLKPRLNALLSGTSRAGLIDLIRRQHAAVDFDQILEHLVTEQMSGFREESPEYYQLFKRLDVLAAAARPATSVALFVTGFGPVGHAIAPVVTDTALQGALHLAGDVAGGTVAAAVGETVISGGASTGVGFLEMRFRRLHTAFTERRAQWLADLLRQNLLGSLNEELMAAATIDQSPEFRAAEEALVALRRNSDG